MNAFRCRDPYSTLLQCASVPGAGSRALSDEGLCKRLGCRGHLLRSLKRPRLFQSAVATPNLALQGKERLAQLSIEDRTNFQQWLLDQASHGRIPG